MASWERSSSSREGIVLFNVVSGPTQKPRIVSELAKSVVTLLAEQTTHLQRLVIVIDTRRRVAEIAFSLT